MFLSQSASRDETLRANRLARDDSSSVFPRAAAAALARDLRTRLKGEVLFDDGSRALYATDASNYRQMPIGVVLPRNVDDVVHTVEVARAHGAPVLSRGGGTSLAGQCCNVAVLIDFSRHINGVIGIDAARRLGTVQPGCVLDTFQHAAHAHGLIFGPDPATHRHCTLGGMLGNNSCGSHSLLSSKHGFGLRTSDNTHELEVLTYDGARFRVGPTPPDELDRIIRGGGRRGDLYAAMKALCDRHAALIRARFPTLGRRVSGYNLDSLLPENGFDVARALVGSESTLVTILEATLHLVPSPSARSLLLLGYPDVFSAGDHVTDILPFEPTALEGIDHLLIEFIKKKGDRHADLALLPDGRAFLIAEFSGYDKADTDAQARRCMAALARHAHAPSMKLYDNTEQEEHVWKVREAGLGSTAFVPGLKDSWPGFEDSAVPPEQVGAYLRDLRRLFDKYGYRPSLYGHFGQGCIHCRVDFDLYTTEGVAHWRAFLQEAAELVVTHHGSISGEHGDGQARAELLPVMYGEDLVRVFREFKAIWDPQGRMNPGKVVDAAAITDHLRLGPDYRPPLVATTFHFPDDHSQFARAALRCVGVGKCRDPIEQTMCPSYMATHDERHSTRGRARLLWEMLNGEVLTGGFRNRAVHEALDLCLACKGCKTDCPVNVDMATYKAEFLSHYYRGRLRPRHAYAMGLIDTWARMASIAPGIANAVASAPGLSRLVKWIGGIASERRVPRLARTPFRRRFLARPHRRDGGMPVILWPDTFTNYFHPKVGDAAVDVLEASGCEVRLPRVPLCCGRPLYDFGMLDRASRKLRRILDVLGPDIDNGVPIVGLEPSCVAVFRDEMKNFFPRDRRAQRLAQQTFLLSEFLAKHAPAFHPPVLRRRALVHGHCHHKAIAGMDDEKAVLGRLGLDYTLLDSGCCGMAGSFGFERGDHYRVSIASGERVLLPAVRAAADDTLLIANGFSCREQIAQTTDRTALHLAEVIRLAMVERGDDAAAAARSDTGDRPAS